MTSTTGRHRIERALASLGLLVALVVVVPSVLMAVSSSRFGSAVPFAGVRPPWRWGADEIRRVAGEPLADSTIIDLLIHTSICVIWLAIGAILLTTIAEIAHMLRHGGIGLPSMCVCGGIQPLARVVATGLLAFAPLHAPKVSLATAGTAGYEVQLPDATTHRTFEPGGTVTHEETSVAHDEVHIVRRGDSVWSIASDLAAGDPDRTVEVADAILDVNLGRTMPDGARFTSPAYIEVGWRLTIPATIRRSELPSEHVVEPGDSLSAIADEHLGDADAWPAIWEANAGATMSDGRTFDDPDLILPGWSIEVPGGTTEVDDVEGGGDNSESADDEGTAREAVVPDDPRPDETIGAGTDEPTREEPATDSSEPETNQDPTGDPTHGAPATGAPTRTTVPVLSAPEEATPAPIAPAEPAVAVGGPLAQAVSTTTTTPAQNGGPPATALPEPRPSVPQPIRIEHAAMLAAGVIALLAVRRRRRLRAALPRTRVPEPRETAAAIERRLRLVDAGERAQRVDVAVRAAAASLLTTEAQIGLVVVAPDGAVTLRLTGDAELPAPWDGDGSAWKLPAGTPIELISEQARLVGTPCIALAQLGVTPAGHDVLVDLEACPALVVQGAEDQIVDQIVTGLATALSASPYAEVAHLVTVSVAESALLDHRNTHRTATADAALRLATSLSGTGRDESSFALRSKCTGGEVWEPVVVFLRPQDGATEPIVARDFASGGGIAVVAGGDVDAVGCHLRPVDDAWTFEGFGTSLDVVPVGISNEEVDDLAELLDESSLPLEPPADVTTAAGDELSSTDADPEPHVPPAHEIVVGLMGEVRVTDAAGRAGSFERSKTVELIAWLATHRERSTRTAARTALWELDVRDATFANVVSEARRGLARMVAPPDGEEWVARTLTERLPVNDLVVTDAQLIEARLDAARLQPPGQALDTLRPAVEMIRDIPFAGTAYLWPDAEGLTSSLVLLAISTAAEMAAHALSIGDIDTVF
ncbi:MAG: LysM peptidoglycan-binding domain-containing protein, partial [Ilumatobacteraceae bacterium]